MTTPATPYPAPLSYDDGEITGGITAVAMLHGVDDFPCLDPEEQDTDAIQAEIDATGHKLIAAYNAHDALVALLRRQLAAMDSTPMSDMNYAGLAWERDARALLESIGGEP
jgi:hypothetical protein